jgi:tyrosyl-tRNA synthetase
MNDIQELLRRGIANIIPGEDKLKKALEEASQLDKKLNIYMGIDPTSTKIHLGHAVPLRFLNRLANMGHNVTFLIGDFTALIGDTSDKDSERPVLTKEQIEENFQTYKKQAEKILDFSKVNVRYNSEWLKDLKFEDIIKLCQYFSAGDFVSRELVAKRLKDGKHVGLHELLYPVMQGYDSYFMDTDIQVGGTDQTFNMQAGRILQIDKRGREESFVVTTTLLEGTDGRKMSKTWDNAIWLDDTAIDIFGKVMSVDDGSIINYYVLATNLSLERIDQINHRLELGENPVVIKKELAFDIVKELFDNEQAEKARNHFEKIVQNGEIPENLIAFQWGDEELNLVEVLVRGKLCSSNSEAKRLISQGGVSVDNKIIIDQNYIVNLGEEHIIRAGRRSYIKTNKYS